MFLRELLKTKYDYYEVAFDGDSQQWVGDSVLFRAHYDILVLFQVPISIQVLRDALQFDQAVYFPMFDACGEAPISFWENFKDFIIINFSAALHQQLLDIGLTSRYVQYFPKPVKIEDWGQSDSAFFWQRTNITINTVAKMLQSLGVNKVHQHIAPDPHFEQVPLAPEFADSFTLSESHWFETRDDMLQVMAASSVYVAPRSYEGIGMSFLEAMAMGRCVLAVDHPTMNEYIVHGVTGVLYPDGSTRFWDNVEYTPEKIRDIQRNACHYIAKGYDKWEKEKYLILDWVEEKPEFNAKLYYTALKKKQFVKTYTLAGLPLAKKTADDRWYLFGKVVVPEKMLQIAKRFLKREL